MFDIIPIDAIQAARSRIRGHAIRTPLIPLAIEDAPGRIYLKLENLQPIGSFKIRGAANALGVVSPDQLAQGVFTASAGNMAQGVAWIAQRHGIPCHVVVPDTAPEAKLEGIRRFGAEIIPVPFAEWWQVIVEHKYPGLDGHFVHPVCQPDVIAGNGTIGLEILEDLPNVDTIIAPYGGGGLACGIASALYALRPQTKVYACEVDTAAPLAAALEHGAPVEVDYEPTFVDGIGGRSVLQEMWPLAHKLLQGSLVVRLPEIAAAIQLLAERTHTIAEGAGAASVAAALLGKAGTGNIVCVVSGGNLNAATLSTILAGEMP